MSIKQHETTEKTVNGTQFYIRPFPAFTAANISGELAAVLAPALAGLAPLALSGGDTDLMNLDVSSFSGALSGLSGDKVEGLLKKLLTKHGNISIETKDGVEPLDNDKANEIFCGAAQDMFVLAVEVINVNFKGFFSKLGSLSGLQKADTAPTTKKTTPKSTDD
ncbi:hypothetical protein AGMMS49975_08970 [Clostridia bacterium]|nr:hypothetical protein AGMMS49975_08970 [Clostridia bacterium]